MPIKHLLLILLVILIWGMNFLFVTFSLTEISPLLLCALRFLFASIPAIFFIKPPAISFKIVALYGLIMFALQFSLLFYGMHHDIAPGMASLLLQTQVFFSMLFASIFLGEKPYSWQIIGALISFTGIGIIALHFDTNMSAIGFICILAAAATWGIGNLITKKIQHINMMALVIWGSFVACFPMLLIAFIFEGPASFAYTYHHLTWTGAGSLAYVVYASTWVGYGVWNWLVSRYPVSMVVPYTLLVPIVAIISSVLVLGEPFQPWKVAAGLFVIGGLCVNILGTRLFVPKIQPSSA